MRFVLILVSFCFACSSEKPAEMSGNKAALKTEKASKSVKTVSKEPTKSTKKAAPNPKPNSKTLGDPRYVIQFPPSKDNTEIKILPLADFKMNVDYPASLLLDKQLAIQPLAGQRKEPSHLSEKQLQFVLPAKTDKPVELKAMVDFSVCNAQACEMVETEVKWTVKPGA